MGISLEITIDDRGCIFLPKEIRDKYGLSKDVKLELITRESSIELIPLLVNSPVTNCLKEPCKTGSIEAHNKLFQRRS